MNSLLQPITVLKELNSSDIQTNRQTDRLSVLVMCLNLKLKPCATLFNNNQRRKSLPQPIVTVSEILGVSDMHVQLLN